MRGKEAAQAALQFNFFWAREGKRLGVQRKGKTPIGPVWAERPELGQVENKWKMNGLLREFWAKLTMCCGKNLF
jgi:hypothetical protein